MKPRHVISLAAIVSLLVIAACQQQRKPPPHSAVATPSSPDAAVHDGSPMNQAHSSQISGDEASETAPQPLVRDAMAQRIESYAKSLDSAIQKRSATRPADEPSAVQWLNPEDFRLSNAPLSSSAAEPALRVEQAPAPQAAVEAARPDAIDAPMSTAPQAPAVDPEAQAQSNSPAVLVDAPAAPAPADVPAVQAASVSLGELHQKLSRRVSDYPRDVCGHLEYQLLQFLMEEPVPHLPTLSRLPAEDRELVTAVLDALSNFRHTLRSDNNMLLSRKMRPLVDLAERLRSQAELTIPSVVLCSRVDAYGLYTPMETRFTAGRPVETIIYCEVDNFASTLNESNLWQVNLSKQVVMYSEAGMQVWEDKPEKVQDFSRTRRRDFFLRKRVSLPATLPIGRYLLKVSIIDEQANRVAEASLPITFVAQ